MSGKPSAPVDTDEPPRQRLAAVRLPGETTLSLNGRPLRLQLSIHDVMPETLHLVDAILESLTDFAPGNTTLLVVPGRRWQAAQVERLLAWARAGYRLAGHGWHHEVHHFGGLYHRLHGLLLSRRVAEHLTLDASKIHALLRRNRGWFEAVGLPAPMLYVPPAWALGAAAPRELASTGFRYLETLGSVHDLLSGHRERIPLIGFEAHNPVQAALLRRWNAANILRARRLASLRVAIHPADPQLLLAGDLGSWLRRLNDSAGGHTQRAIGSSLAPHTGRWRARAGFRRSGVLTGRPAPLSIRP